MRGIGAWYAIAVLCAVVGCSGGSSVLTTRGTHATPTPVALASATPAVTPSPGATSSAAIAAANASLASVQTMYAALPHADPSADLATLSAEMVSSGRFKMAVVTDGGISATLANGTPALIFGDRIGDTTNATAASKASHARAGERTRQFANSFLGKPETIGVLVNTTDDSGAFNPQNQASIADAISNSGFASAQYGVDVGDVELESFDALSSGGVVDVLDISTHGLVANNPVTGMPGYWWLSDTPLTGAELAKYVADYTAGTLTYAVVLDDDYPAQFAFSPGFVANHVHFQTGAIVINDSCFGMDSQIATQVGATLESANVGRYFGWTKPVDGKYADQTDAFIWDRVLGEGTSTLGNFVTQRSPAQRPFPLDDVQDVMGSETRSGPPGTNPTLTYAQSPSDPAGTLSTFSYVDYNGETDANPPIEYFIPSISNVAVTEDPASPTLTINGAFPPQPGTVTIADPSQSRPTPMTPTSWTTTQIVVPIAVSGPGSKGNVVVVSQYGVTSNAVPLTQWNGTLAGTENAAWTSMGGGVGTGSGTIASSFSFDFRADVHPTVQTIDASPVPQNLTFTNVEGDSTGQVASVGGSFATSDGKHSATLGMSPSATTLAPGTPAAGNVFYLRAIAGGPPSCNNSMPGPQSGPTNVFCPNLGFSAIDAGTCVDDDGTLCSSALWNVSGNIGRTTAANDGLLIFTMDPDSYAIDVSSTSPDLPADLFEATPQLTGGVTGSIGTPISPPTSKTVSARKRTSVRTR